MIIMPFDYTPFITSTIADAPAAAALFIILTMQWPSRYESGSVKK